MSSRKLTYKFWDFAIPLVMIIFISVVTNFFSINEKILNRDYLWDAIRPYNTFLYEMNLPDSVGAILIAGTPEDITKTERYYGRGENGLVFINQLISLLFGIKITVFSQAYLINFLFGVSAVLFSILVGYLIFQNGYISVVVFSMIVIFRNLCPGLIYGLPLRHLFAVFNPLMVFPIFIFIAMSVGNFTKKYYIIFPISGFVVAFIGYIRASEGMVITYSLILFILILSIQQSIGKKDFVRILRTIVIIFAAIYIGYFGFQKMVTAFEHHRDTKFNLPPDDEELLQGYPPFHALYASVFRFDNPNLYSDWISYKAVFKKYPEIKNKFITDASNPSGSVIDDAGTIVDLTEMGPHSIEYHKAVKEIYFEHIFDNPKHFFTYIVKSVYDYFLFLPYYSWTGTKSAHAHLPIIEKGAAIAPQDFAPGYGNKLLLNLKFRYLPGNPLFWIYFVVAYAILIQAIYVSLLEFKKNIIERTVDNKILENKLPIYVLQGMLLYFFFASIIRMLVPAHGQGAVVTFNIIVIYNCVRLAFVGLRTNEFNK